MEKQPFDILAINETRLDKTVPDSVVNLVGYNFVRQDRNRNGEGVCVYIRTSIEFRGRLDLENDSLEMIALDIKKPNSQSFLVSCWYRPPHSPVECFDIFGGINCNDMSNSKESHTSRLVNLIETHQLWQLINKPTRVTKETRTRTYWPIHVRKVFCTPEFYLCSKENQHTKKQPQVYRNEELQKFQNRGVQVRPERCPLATNSQHE